MHKTISRRNKLGTSPGFAAGVSRRCSFAAAASPLGADGHARPALPSRSVDEALTTSNLIQYS